MAATHAEATRQERLVKRAATLKAIILGAAMSGLVVVSAGAATADTGTTFSRDGGSTATATDYGRGTTRSDNSPGTAGGLS
jgi:hypothetical protein